MKKQFLSHLAALMLFLSQLVANCPTCFDQQNCDCLCAQGLPNISTRTCGNWDLFADAFAWFASEEASAVWVDIVNVGNNTSSFTAQDLSFDWNFGFRAGVGYNLEYDQWDTQLYWTSFHTKADQSIEEFPVGTLLVSEIHPEFFAADLSDTFSHRAKIHWTLHYNMCDWELGRNYWVSKGLSFRPFIGLKGGWIDQSIQVHYNNLIIAGSSTENSSRENVKNNFWGIGPVGGVNSKWKLRNFCNHYPSLFGDFSAATLWGTWICSDLYNDTTGKKIIVNMRNSTLGALMFRGFLGIGWDVDINRGRSHFATRLGYEMQLWVNQLRVATSQLIRLHGDLTLQGVTFNCRFDF